MNSSKSKFIKINCLQSLPKNCSMFIIWNYHLCSYVNSIQSKMRTVSRFVFVLKKLYEIPKAFHSSYLRRPPCNSDLVMSAHYSGFVGSPLCNIILSIDCIILLIPPFSCGACWKISMDVIFTYSECFLWCMVGSCSLW